MDTVQALDAHIFNPQPVLFQGSAVTAGGDAVEDRRTFKFCLVGRDQ
jgi:hypothetical protein